MQVERRRVWVWFGRPIEPERVAPFIRLARMVDWPLDVDELEGSVIDWHCRSDGWHGMVEYRHACHGIGWGNYIGWFPAGRLRPLED